MGLVDNFLLNKYKDPEQSNFQKTNLFFETNPFLLTQDPSVVSFIIMFGFNSPLLRKDGSKNSALAYLNSIGETERAIYLEKFIDTLKYISDNMSWYFQGIEGLDEAWKRDFSTPRINGELSIECLDDVSFKMTGLIDLYRKACFDWTNQREVVPMNLRKFDMMVYVFDGRIVKDTSSLKDDIQSFVPDLKKNTKSTKDVVNDMFGKIVGDNDNRIDVDNATRILFHFQKCQFNLDSGSKIFASLSNKEMTSGEQELKIDYHGVEETNLYHIFGSGKVADTLTGSLDIQAISDNQIAPLSFVDGALLKAEEIASNLARGLVNNQADKLKAKAAAMILETVGGNSASLNNDTEQIPAPGIPPTNNSPSLTNDTENL